MAVGERGILRSNLRVRVDDTDRFTRQVDPGFFIEAEIIDVLEQSFLAQHLIAKLYEAYVTGTLDAVKE
ncbi:hypothetical protein D3C71_2139420 [compost metagenome]